MGKFDKETNNYSMSNYISANGNDLLFTDEDLNVGNRYVFFEYSKTKTISEMKNNYKGLISFSGKEDPLMILTFNCVARSRGNLSQSLGAILKDAVPKNIPFALVQCGGEISPMSIKITGDDEVDDLNYSPKDQTMAPHSTGFSSISNLMTIKNKLKLSMSM